MKKGCELCGKPARMYCDSDQAILCWDCDERVHCANFLVAKHSRCLLCHVCQSPTPWKASGTKLGPTMSVCEGCYNSEQTTRRRQEEEEMESFVGEDSDDSEAERDEECSDRDDYSEDDDGVDSMEEEEDGENQVVPWSPSAVPSSSGPPVTASSASEQGSLSTRDGGEAVSSALKRFLHNPRLDFDDEDEDGCSSSQVNSKTAAMEENGESFRAMKMARTEEYSSATGETESRKHRRREIISSLMRFQQRMVCGVHNASEINKGISKLSRDL